MQRKNLAWAGLLGGIVGIAMAAGQAPAPITLTATTRLVEIEVWARDAQGIPVNGLTRDDFKISDNGAPRAFTILAVNSPAPASPAPAPSPRAAAAAPTNTFTNLGEMPMAEAAPSAVILIDGINGWFENYSMAQKAVIGMLGQIPADERIALYALSRAEGLVILQNYTTDRARLLQAIRTYEPGGMCADPVPPSTPRYSSSEAEMAALNPTYISPCEGVGTQEILATGGQQQAEEMAQAQAVPAQQQEEQERQQQLRLGSIQANEQQQEQLQLQQIRQEQQQRPTAEAVRRAFQALAQALAGQPGRKSIYWVTQGFAPNLMQGEYKSTWDQTIEQLNDANVAVNTVDSNGLSQMRRLGGSAAIQTVWNMAADTGGQAYVNRGDLDGAMAAGITAVQDSYTLGFYLTALDGDYHSLKVSVDRPGVILNYRQGYFAQNDAQRAVMQKQSELGDILVDPQDQVQIGITAGAKITPGTPPGSVQLHLNLRSLTLSQDKPGKWSGRAEAMFIENNAAGKEVARITETLKWAMNAAQQAQVASRGLDKDTTLKLAPGAVRLTIAIRDAASGRLGSLRIPLEQ